MALPAGAVRVSQTTPARPLDSDCHLYIRLAVTCVDKFPVRALAQPGFFTKDP
jgi:hypothetical protein